MLDYDRARLAAELHGKQDRREDVGGTRTCWNRAD